MLRRTQPIASDEETEAPVAGPPSAAYADDSGIERRRHPRVKLDIKAEEKQEVEEVISPRVERRKGERRKMEELRSDMQWTTVTEKENGFFGAMRGGSRRGAGMGRARIALLGVAIVAGSMAAFLAMQSAQQTTEPTLVREVVQEARTQILVAKQPIGIGQRLSAATIAWEDWPEGAVLSDYVTMAAAPDAMTDMKDAVARFEFFAGDPIREQKLVQASQGYLSAILESGKRGVSVSVSADAASGGFITPNDQVDVVLSRETRNGLTSETILYNVRVLAIDTRLGETGITGAPDDAEDPKTGIFTDQAIATLELDSAESELIIGATAVGKITLVLRSMVDFAEPDKNENSGINRTIRMTSPFWSQSDETAVR